MKFSVRLTLSTVAPALLFSTALVVSLAGLFRVEHTYAGLLAREERLAAGASSLYAEGLQMGQALRNIVLDPADTKAQDNLQKAAENFEQRYQEMRPLAQGTPIEPMLAEVGTLRAQHREVQQAVLAALAADPASAVSTLKQKETPAWRALRAKVMDLGKQAQDMLAASDSAAQATAARAKAWAMGLAVLAIAVAVVSLLLARRTMCQTLGGEPEDAGRLLRNIAEGDLTQQIPAAACEGSLLSELARTQSSLRRLVGEVRQLADGILTASGEVAAGSLDLSSRTEQAASHLQETAASMAQISGSVQQGVASAAEAKRLAGSASDVAQRGGSAVRNVVQAMDEISAQSRKIGDITGVIDGIAFQTNILALNAAVEAARAGEAGRGFAVVASEVRALAQRTSVAAREVRGLIQASAEQVATGSQQTEAARSAMDSARGAIDEVHKFILQLSHGMQEQMLGVNQINQAVSDMDSLTQKNAALVEEIAASATTLRDKAGEVASSVSVFQLKGGARTAAAPAPDAVALRKAMKAQQAAAPAQPAAPAARAPQPSKAKLAAPKPRPAAPAPAPAPEPALSASHDDGDWTSF